MAVHDYHGARLRRTSFDDRRAGCCRTVFAGPGWASAQEVQMVQHFDHVTIVVTT